LLLGIDHLLHHTAHTHRRLIDRQHHVFAHAGLVLLLLDGGKEVAVLLEGKRIESRDVASTALSLIA
jgi:hypothetical protein